MNEDVESAVGDLQGLRREVAVRPFPEQRVKGGKERVAGGLNQLQSLAGAGNLAGPETLEELRHNLERPQIGDAAGLFFRSTLLERRRCAGSPS